MTREELVEGFARGEIWHIAWLVTGEPPEEVAIVEELVTKGIAKCVESEIRPDGIAYRVWRKSE